MICKSWVVKAKAEKHFVFNLEYVYFDINIDFISCACNLWRNMQWLRVIVRMLSFAYV